MEDATPLNVTENSVMFNFLTQFMLMLLHCCSAHGDQLIVHMRNEVVILIMTAYQFIC